MYLGCLVYIRHNGEVKEGNVITIFAEDLEIKLLDGTTIMRKFWEIKKVEIKNEEE